MPESTFPPPGRRELTSRRRKINQACDFCRKHRIRCETTTPCPPCVANNVTCIRSRQSNTPRKKEGIQSQNRRNEQLPGGSSWAPVAAASDSPPRDEEHVPPIPSPEENLAWTSHKTDSMLGFISRINAFCSGVSELSPGTTPSGTNTSPEQISSFSSRIPDETNFMDCDLSATQIERLLQIFWSRILPQMPIVTWKDISPGGGLRAVPSPLMDAIIAFSLQQIYHTRLHKRLVGLKWPHFERTEREIGMSYFRRCLSAITQLATFANPSIFVMQCYCYLVSYLLDSGQQQAAYNMVGLALRISQTLNYMDSRTGGYRECQHFRRIWWTLIHLDFRCSRHIGKPVTNNLKELMCLRPTREPEDRQMSNGLLCHSETIRLTAAALLVNEAMGRFEQDPKSRDIDRRAQNLSENLLHLQGWCDEIRNEPSLAHIQLDIPDVSGSQQEITIETEPMHNSNPEMEVLLITMLRLQYHNVIMSLHRVFIQFPSSPLVPKSRPKADAHAATALNHALVIIEVSHQKLTTHEVLNGIRDIYQHIWNAVITIIGFMLAYPYCHRCTRARKFLEFALEIFDSADNENSIAVRAASLTRQLRGKVDTLIQTLKIGQRPVNSTESSVSTVRSQDQENSLPSSSWSALQNEDALFGELEGDSLWSWAEFINLDLWPSYCDEVNEAFTDMGDFSIL
ncbi:hypothetical protein PENSTE_c001G07335 [Penicillium steckii]|uniref:Zn(2)-C6 fungal-type domain-containing protein n=1 Tax=Penicillium steckii TaxID=303698 RepID=A0A1V6TZY1_9EURO|nr:hypothetical protein PENSTE_c001G07335 [Penicillium steckii]